jgi:hypothetical protein
LYTFQILTKLSNFKLIDGLRWIKLTHDRLKGFKSEHPYQKIPRDTCRVTSLALSSYINKEICYNIRNPDLILTYLRAIYEGLKMVEVDDLHINQIV